MTQHFAPVVPASIERAKRVAKQLHAAYPNTTLATCQATTAHLFGHKDWYGLGRAIKHNAPSAPFDEDLGDDAFNSRVRGQCAMLVRELAGINPDAEHSSTKKSGGHNHDDAFRYARLAAANARWEIQFAAEIREELQPTAKHAPAHCEYDDYLVIYSFEAMSALPKTLGRWWAFNIPDQPEVAAAISSFPLAPNRRTSLMQFARYWGMLCVHYASTIDLSIAMGVAYLLAERYASLHVQDSEVLYEYADRSEKASEADLDNLLNSLSQEAFRWEETFFSGFPRDDFASVFASQPNAFIDNAQEVINILSTPKSRNGIWKSSSDVPS